jgi:hypothetical protein
VKIELVGTCQRGHDCDTIDVTSMGDNAPRRINALCHECADLCDWCDHHVNEHSQVLASHPCLDCACPSYHRNVPSWLKIDRSYQ